MTSKPTTLLHTSRPLRYSGGREEGRAEGRREGELTAIRDCNALLVSFKIHVFSRWQPAISPMFVTSSTHTPTHTYIHMLSKPIVQFEHMFR